MDKLASLISIRVQISFRIDRTVIGLSWPKKEKGFKEYFVSINGIVKMTKI